MRTGVTAILPHGGNLFRDKVAGGVFVGNAFGKLAGSTQVQELGTIETPIVLTNTLAVGTAIEAVVAEALAEPGNEDVRSVNAVVGETNDGGLNDIRGRHVTPRARAGRDPRRGRRPGGRRLRRRGHGDAVPSTGRAGSAPRRACCPRADGGYTVGVLVQANFGGVLTIDGVPVGRELRPTGTARAARSGDGSCMIVVATDAPLDRARPRAPGRPRRLRPGPHRLLVQQRQRRLRDRLLDRARGAHPPRRDGGPHADPAAHGGRLAPVPGRRWRRRRRRSTTRCCGRRR